jgi:hypothetical protein
VGLPGTTGSRALRVCPIRGAINAHGGRLPDWVVVAFERGLRIMRGIGRSVDACEYGRTGVMGWAQEHALMCALGAVLGWLVVVYSAFTVGMTLH